jgi:uncharacterized protein YkwD
MRYAFLTLAVGLVVGACAIGQTPAEVESFREALVKEINALRKAKGSGPLKRNALLDAAAQKHVENLAMQDKIGDDGKNPHVLDGKTPSQRVKAEGYKSVETGENLFLEIKKGSKFEPAASAAGRADYWNKSPGHQATLLKASLVETGIGVAKGKNGKWWYCQVFATPAG